MYRIIVSFAAMWAMLPTLLPAEESAARPALLWRYNAGSAVTAPPACRENRIAFTTRAGAVILLDTNGRFQGTLTARDGTNGPAAFAASPVFAAGRIVVASRHGWVSALETNGATAWQYDCGEEIKAAPLVATDAPVPRLFVLTQASGVVHCLDAQTGRRIWVSANTGRCEAAAALAAGRIIFGNCEAVIHSFDAATGQAAGRIALCEECQVAAGIATDGPLAYVGTRCGTVYCVDVHRGAAVWTNGASRAETFTTPALGDRLVVVGSFDGSLYALDRASGASVWKFPCSGTPGDPVLHNGDVFFGDRGTLRAVSLASGKERWSVAITDEIQTPIVFDGRLLVGGDDGSLSAYRIPPAQDSTPGKP